MPRCWPATATSCPCCPSTSKSWCKNGSGFEVLRLLRMARVFRCADPPHLSTRLSSQPLSTPHHVVVDLNTVLLVLATCCGTRVLLSFASCCAQLSTTIIKVCERQCSSFVQCFDHTLASAVHLGTRAGSTLVCARWYLCCAGLRPSMRGRADYLCLLLLPPSRAHAV